MASPAYAVVVPDGAKPEIVSDFSGGLFTASPAHKIPNNFSPYLRNVFIDNDRIERVNGFIVAGSTFTLQKVTGIYPYIKEDGTTKFLVTDSSVTLETSDFSTWVLVSSNSNTGVVLRWTQVRNKMWGFNGIDFVKVWDDTVLVILNGNNTGSIQTPNVPKFKYLAYDLDRVWGLSIPGAASDLYFTSVITTDAVIVAPDDYRAWPIINLIHVGQGDGQIGTALWVYDGQLRVGKERSIYTRYGDSPSNFNVRKEEAQVGVASQDSIVILDGVTHFMGQDGIYKNVNRISDKITPDFQNINKDNQKVIQNAWETQADFNKGKQYGTTPTSDGILTIDTQPYWVAINTGNTGNFGPFLELTTTGTQFSQFGVFLPTSVPSNRMGYLGSSINAVDTSFFAIYSRVFSVGDNGLNCGNPQFDLVIRNSRTNEIGRLKSSPMPCSLTFGPYFDWTYQPVLGREYNATPLFTADDLALGNMQLQISTASNGQPLNSNVLFQFYPSTLIGSVAMKLTPSTTVQFISDVSTLTSVTTWGNFDSANLTNGGSINFYFRSSTSSINIATQTWARIIPGVTISAPLINNYIQWASTITGIGIPLPLIDNVLIFHVEGAGSLTRPVATDWKNRYWLATSTTADQFKTLIYVKSMSSNDNPDAWMPMEGIDIRCFGKNGDTLYGGSSSTGTVYRLDYGTNYNGTAIDSIYDTPEMAMGDFYFDKTLNKLLVDGEKSIGATMNLQYSLNQRTFISKPFSISGTGRYNKVMTGVTDNGSFKTLRVRLENAQLDAGFIVNNLGIIYAPTSVLTDK